MHKQLHQGDFAFRKRILHINNEYLEYSDKIVKIPGKL